MTTIINTPPTTESSGHGFLIGLIAVIIMVGMFMYFGLPAIRNTEPSQINVAVPQVDVPDKIDVTVSPTE